MKLLFTSVHKQFICDCGKEYLLLCNGEVIQQEELERRQKENAETKKQEKERQENIQTQKKHDALSVINGIKTSEKNLIYSIMRIGVCLFPFVWATLQIFVGIDAQNINPLNNIEIITHFGLAFLLGAFIMFPVYHMVIPQKIISDFFNLHPEYEYLQNWEGVELLKKTYLEQGLGYYYPFYVVDRK